jgi:hypothetical protein
MLRLLNPFSRLKSADALAKEYVELIRTIRNNLPEESRFILDDSKSIYSLYLLGSGGANVKVIHLVRDGKETVNSFKKHGVSFAYGLASWVLTNLFSRLLLWRTRTSYITVNYAELCNDPVGQLARLGEFIGCSNDPADYVQRVRSSTFHVVAGNPLLNEQCNIREFQGIRNTTGKELLLSGSEARIAGVVSTICKPLMH